MDAEFTPEPSPEEREALEAALERLLSGVGETQPEAYASRWRRAGLRENVEPQGEP